MRSRPFEVRNQNELVNFSTSSCTIMYLSTSVARHWVNIAPRSRETKKTAKIARQGVLRNSPPTQLFSAETRAECFFSRWLLSLWSHSGSHVCCVAVLMLRQVSSNTSRRQITSCEQVGRLVTASRCSDKSLRVLYTGEFLSKSLSLQQDFVTATRRTNFVSFDFLWLVAATKLCCREEDFHKTLPVDTKRF